MVSSLIGRYLGKYEITELIGQGGMATVYKGYRADIDRYVAVKVLPPHPGQNNQFIERFQREARTIARLQHPHILPLYDYGVEEDVVYLAMAYVDGGSLGDLIDKGPLSPHEIEPVIRQVASALDYAHRKGIIHRDIKPDNILLDREGHALLADFGIAKLMEGDMGLTGTGNLVGTPAYMSPEQCQGIEVTAQSDIYALGVIAYEMLTGQQPFQADTPMQMVLKHVMEPAPNITQVISTLPAHLGPVMLRVLAKNPEDRYATATSFLQDFARGIHNDETHPALDPSATIVLQTGPRTPLLLRIGQSPLAFVSSFVLFIALVMLGLTGLNQSRAMQMSVVALAGNSGLLSFSSTNFLGDTVNLRVDNLAAPSLNEQYVLWLYDNDTAAYLRLGALALDALGNGALAYTDSEGRTLPTTYDEALITLESRESVTGMRINAPNLRRAVLPDQPSGEPVYQASVPPVTKQALQAILISADDGLDDSGLLASALLETQTALDNHLAFNSQTNPGSLRTQAEHIINILLGTATDYNGNGSGENPGRGVGVPYFLDRITALLDDIDQATASAADTSLIRVCVENTRSRVNRIVELQERIITSPRSAAPLYAELDQLFAALIPGIDQNANGRIEAFRGECGLEQIASFGILVSNMPLEAGVKSVSG